MACSLEAKDNGVPAFADPFVHSDQETHGSRPSVRDGHRQDSSRPIVDDTGLVLPLGDVNADEIHVDHHPTNSGLDPADLYKSQPGCLLEICGHAAFPTCSFEKPCRGGVTL